MANPRQRSKAKSHKTTKPSLNQKRRMHQKLRRAPPLKGPQVLAESWDRRKTVFQNYAALGLLPSIPLPTGASSSRSHRAPISLPPNADANTDTNSAQGFGTGASAGVEATPKISYGRIVRDDQGNVIDIILEDDEEGASASTSTAQVDGALNPEEEYQPEAVEAKTDVVRSLENMSAGARPVKRHSSTSEREWLSRLVKLHGDDYERMARDKSLNVWQKTPGEIKRMVRKAGGVDKLAHLQ